MIPEDREDDRGHGVEDADDRARQQPMQERDDDVSQQRRQPEQHEATVLEVALVRDEQARADDELARQEECEDDRGGLAREVPQRAR